MAKEDADEKGQKSGKGSESLSHMLGRKTKKKSEEDNDT